MLIYIFFLIIYYINWNKRFIFFSLIKFNLVVLRRFYFLNGFFKKNSIWSEEQNDGTWI